MRIAIGLAVLTVALLALACESEEDGAPPGERPTTTQIQPTPHETCVIEAEGLPPTCVTIEVNGDTCRSEERRVGKECRL